MTTEPHTSDAERLERVARAIEIAIVERTMHHPVSKMIVCLGWLWPSAARAAIAADSTTLAAENERLREAAIRGALCLSGFAGEGLTVDGHEDPADAWTRIAAAVGLPDGDDDDLRAALAGREPQVVLGALSALDWLSGATNLELHHYSPMRCDDDDEAVEWRVSQVNGGINDREWTIVGRGVTALDAILSARAALGSIEP